MFLGRWYDNKTLAISETKIDTNILTSKNIQLRTFPFQKAVETTAF